jgi:broad specificity phosphatase PhoE
MKLILVRHGESVGNFENRLQGQEDFDLTDLGREQALRTGDRLAAEGVTAVYTSPLLRAANTARTIADELEVEPVLLPEVSEYHFGEMSGSTYREVRDRFAANPSSANVTAAERVYPGEEGRDVFFERVTSAMWRIVERHRGESVAVVSHGGPIALFCQTVLGLPYRRPMPFSVNNCSLSVIDIPDDAIEPRSGAVLLTLNDTAHLRGIDTSHPA